MRSQKLTNRSIHTIKKTLLREVALQMTTNELLELDGNQSLSRVRDIWDLDYKSTSDEEDNDSDDED